MEYLLESNLSSFAENSPDQKHLLSSGAIKTLDDTEVSDGKLLSLEKDDEFRHIDKRLNDLNFNDIIFKRNLSMSQTRLSNRSQSNLKSQFRRYHKSLKRIESLESIERKASC